METSNYLAAVGVIAAVESLLRAIVNDRNTLGEG
jgi:hypothetical protein